MALTTGDHLWKAIHRLEECVRMAKPMRRAVTLEVGMQTAGLGVYLTSSLFDGGDAIALAPALYTFGRMLTGTILATYWSRIDN